MAFMAIQLAGDSAPNGARQAACPDGPAAGGPPLAEGGEGGLPDRAEAQDVPAEAGGHGQHGGDHRAAGPGQVAPAVDPGGVEAQGLLHARSPRPRSSPCRPARGRWRGRRCRRVSRPASATAPRQASTVSDSGSTMRRRPRAERPIPDRTDRCSKRSGPSGARGVKGPGAGTGFGPSGSPVGSKRGSQTSSCCSKRTDTAWPTCTSVGSHPTTAVVSRTSGSSARATTASAYGGSRSGCQRCWLTV